MKEKERERVKECKYSVSERKKESVCVREKARDIQRERLREKE